MQRLPLLILAAVGLIIGVGTGLARLGWNVPSIAVTTGALHGPLMVCGFFGVVISLERAVAIGRTWTYLGPLLAGLGSIAALAGASATGAWLFFAASCLLLAATFGIFLRQAALFTFTLSLGALCWLVGNALWATGATVHTAAPWWLAFLIFTIGGERLELSRLMPPSKFAKAIFVAILVAISAGLLGGGFVWGAPVFAAGLLGLSGWLLKQDIARRTVHNKGLTRFMAVCLLSGYVWLAVGACVVLVAGGLATGSQAYDAALHAFALGFVFSMVFGHAPIIFPAVLRVAIPYHPYFYIPLALLHISLLVRLAGDAAGNFDWTRAGGLLNAIALAAFVLGAVTAAVRGRRRRAPAA